MIDEATVECEEDGFELVLTGDFQEAFETYVSSDAATVKLRLSQDAAIQLSAAVRSSIGPWADEYDREHAAYLGASLAERRAVLHGVPDDDRVELLLEAGDLARTAERENRG